MAAPNRTSVLSAYAGSGLTRERALWALALLLVGLDVALAATGTRPVAAGPTRLAATLSLDPLVALAGLKALALGLAAGAWWVLPTHLRVAVPGVVAGASAGVLLAGTF
jgi:hypothetical protein